jgi:hypothetical protein
MRIAYADPPYLGQCARYDHQHGTSGTCWDQIETHHELVRRLAADFPDGWAVSCSSPMLHALLPACPDDIRVAAWVKPFAIFKPNVNPAYAWEPVIWRGGRQRRSREELTIRDWVAAGINTETAFQGAKPHAFCWWLFDLLGLTAEDTFVDLFPGTGIVAQVWMCYQRQGRLFAEPSEVA